MVEWWNTATVMMKYCLIKRPIMISVASLCFVLSACLLVPLPSGGLQSASPVWTREVLRQGFPPSKAKLLPPRPGIIFLDNQRLIVYETDWTGGLSSRVSPDISSTYQLNASVIDAQSGKPLFDKHWGTRVVGSTIHVAAGGLLVQSGNELRILSDDFAEIRKMTFPDSSDDPNDPNHCYSQPIGVSPTGQTIIMNCIGHIGLHYFSRLEVLNGKTFVPEYTWTESLPWYERNYSISDEGIVAGLKVRQFGSNGWQTFIEARQTGNLNTSDVRSALTFVTNSSLICFCYGGISLVSTAGHILATKPIPQNIIIGNQHNSASQVSSVANKVVAVARDGQFIAVSFDRWKIKSHVLTEASSRRISTQILVCDSLLRHCPLTVDVTPIPPWDSDYDFALSPDGSKLAVLNGRDVSVFFVPDN
ncbi:MAG: hypothetical protein ACYDCM_10800 [Candidatus Acidiferrales bacterium]